MTLVVSVGDQVRVPDIFNKPLPEAQRLLEEAGLKLGDVAQQTREDVPPDQRPVFDKVAPGAVLSASPNYGTFMPRGSRITVAIRQAITAAPSAFVDPRGMRPRDEASVRLASPGLAPAQ